MRQRIGRQLGAVAVFASALIAISPTVAFAVPGATNALAEQTSHSTMVTPNQPSHAGFAAIPAYAGPSYHICLLNSTKVTYCIQSNGVGKQVTITSDKSNWSNFTDYATDLSISGEPVQRVENGNGNCLRENNSNQVVIANGGCVASDLDGEWGWPDPYYIYNGVWQNYQDQTDDMLVHGNVNGYKVWAAKPVSGDWTKWTPPATPQG